MRLIAVFFLIGSMALAANEGEVSAQQHYLELQYLVSKVRDKSPVLNCKEFLKEHASFFQKLERSELEKLAKYAAHKEEASQTEKAKGNYVLYGRAYPWGMHSVGMQSLLVLRRDEALKLSDEKLHEELFYSVHSQIRNDEVAYQLSEAIKNERIRAKEIDTQEFRESVSAMDARELKMNRGQLELKWGRGYSYGW